MKFEIFKVNPLRQSQHVFNNLSVMLSKTIPLVFFPFLTERKNNASLLIKESISVSFVQAERHFMEITFNLLSFLPKGLPLPLHIKTIINASQ